jgi:hypothetical protein
MKPKPNPSMQRTEARHLAWPRFQLRCWLAPAIDADRYAYA